MNVTIKPPAVDRASGRNDLTGNPRDDLGAAIRLLTDLYAGARFVAEHGSAEHYHGALVAQVITMEPYVGDLRTYFDQLPATEAPTRKREGAGTRQRAPASPEPEPDPIEPDAATLAEGT